MRKLVLFFTLLAFHVGSFADKITIHGNAPSYSGDKLQIMYHEDAFIYQVKKLDDFNVDANGQFKIDIELSETRLIFIPLGIYKGFLYLEPGKQYEIKLPPKKELSPAQKLNPFFEADELMLGIVNHQENELNILIRELDDKLDSFINQNFHKIYRKKDQSPGINFVQELKLKYANIDNSFFKKYLKYRLGFLDFLAYPNAFVKIENEYFSGKKIQVYNPAYMSLFKKQYGNFLNTYIKQKEATKVNEALQSNETYAQLNQLLKTYPAYQNAQFRDLLIASSIFDSYSRKFIGSKKALKIYKDIIQSSSVAYNQNLCRNLIARITHLKPGYPAPNFKIGDVNLANYKGKYLYLNFCNTQSYPCIQDFKEMEKLREQFGENIEFLSIACDWDLLKFHHFVQTNKYPWPILHIGNQHQLIHQYNVKAFPSYFLIDPKGNIVKAPASSPKENIRMDFIKIAREILKKKSF